MLKVLLIDDEEVIVEGLKRLIDWGAEGFEVESGVCCGEEAVRYLENHRVDLIVTDVKMPGLSGLDLIREVRNRGLSDARFVVLSGYRDFEFARQALRLGCVDYLLKPVSKNDLKAVLRKISSITVTEEPEKIHEQTYLARHMARLLYGRHDDADLKYVEEHLGLTGALRYVEINFAHQKADEEDDDRLNEAWRELYQAATTLLGSSGQYVYYTDMDTLSSGVGFLLSENMMKRERGSEANFLRWLSEELGMRLNSAIHILAGEKVSDLAYLSQSYESACKLKTWMSFQIQKLVSFYEDEVREPAHRTSIRKEVLDRLVSAIEANNINEIHLNINAFFREIRGGSVHDKDVNVHYLLYRLTELAYRLDSETDQEEIVRFISDSSCDSEFRKGDRQHLERFALEYAAYLSLLKREGTEGILESVEREIRENYRENLKLQDLGRKYFINSSYLGQIFRKKYGVSFKNYLTATRIRQAERELLQTDKSITQIGSDVGYRDTDYFISKFIEMKGCTPSRFRKSRGSGGKQ